MLTVLGRNNSINVQKVMWTIGELGLDYERKDIGGAFGQNKEDWYLDLNPNGLVPVLQDEAGAHWESNSVVRYLTARHDAGGMWPEDPAIRSVPDRWMDWMTTVLNPAMFPVFWGLFRTPPEQRDMDLINAKAEDLAHLFAMLDKQLKGRAYIGGDSFTMGDVPVGCATYRWYGLDVPHPDLPDLKRWYDSLTARPAYREHVMLPIT